MKNVMQEMWEFKHEPDNLKDAVYNKEVRKKLENALEDVPNLMLYGGPGVGKGTFANILIKHTGYDHLWVNASDETGIEFVRTGGKVKNFATSLGITPLKIVIMNEADSLTRGAQGAQKALKQLMEDVHKITRFIFLTNSIEAMMTELQDRCHVIEVSNPPAKEMYLFAAKILKSEGIKFDKKNLLSIIKKCYPSIRNMIRSLQVNIKNKELTGDLISLSEEIWKEIFENIKKKDVDTVRKILKSNYINYTALYEYLYNNCGEFKEPGGAIILIGDHLVTDANVAIKEINFMHMIVQGILRGVW